MAQIYLLLISYKIHAIYPGSSWTRGRILQKIYWKTSSINITSSTFLIIFKEDKDEHFFTLYNDLELCYAILSLFKCIIYAYITFYYKKTRIRFYIILWPLAKCLFNYICSLWLTIIIINTVLYIKKSILFKIAHCACSMKSRVAGKKWSF